MSYHTCHAGGEGGEGGTEGKMGVGGVFGGGRAGRGPSISPIVSAKAYGRPATPTRC